MRIATALLIIGVGLMPAQVPAIPGPVTQSDFDGWINRGHDAFRAARYQDAIDAYQHAVDLKASDPKGHVHLGTAYMQIWIPGASSPENVANASHAEAEFRRVLDLDHSNVTALESLAVISYNQASPEQGESKLARLEEARQWNRELLAIDSQNKEAHYWMGVIAWSEFYPVLMTARLAAGMTPGDPGPLSNVASRRELASRYTPLIEDGIAHLAKAIELDELYADAMAYMNLLVRERGDLRETAAEYKRDIAEADEWVKSALAAKRRQAQSLPNSQQIGAAFESRISAIAAAAPPPPPPPPPAPISPEPPQRIRFTGNVQEKRLIGRVDPVCPGLATQARIQGMVKFTLIIGKDGLTQNIQVISGHPLLVPAALQAVKQWRYEPTLLNGTPVEVIAPVEVAMSCVN
jgi:tetratricopeptide (TPR) repeat protein